MTGVAPGYEQKTIPAEDKRGVLRLIASPDRASDSVSIHADATIYAGLFDDDEHAELVLNPARKGYVHLIRGVLDVTGQQLNAGDAVMLENERSITVSKGGNAEVLVFDFSA